MYNYCLIQPCNLRVRRINTDGIPPIVQSVCSQMFSLYQFTDEFVVYHEFNNQFIVLGILHVVENKINNSIFFPSFQENSIVINNSDPTELSEFKAFQIDYWWFDEVLRNAELLETVFSIISYCLGNVDETVLLWRDSRNELEYYPISNDSIKFPIGSVGKYFAEKFINN